jgi:beta-phosphoglucomutase
LDVIAMLEAVIFDFYGVILDSEPIHYEACCLILELFGISLSYDE